MSEQRWAPSAIQQSVRIRGSGMVKALRAGLVKDFYTLSNHSSESLTCDSMRMPYFSIR
jgi:hypothetical protein